MLTAHHPDPSILAALDDQGYALLPGRFDATVAQDLGRRLDDLISAEGDRAGLEVHRENGTDRLANLVDKGTVFDHVWSDPLVLGCVAHVLARPFKLSSLNAREPKPGQGAQGLHADWGPRDDGPFHVVNSLWLIDGMDEGNGPTRLVPRSHLRPGSPDQDATSIEVHAPPGTVLVFNAHTWHGGTVNRSGRRRRVIHAYYVAAEHPQQCDFPRLVSEGTRARLDADRQRLLGLSGAGWMPTELVATR